MILGHLAGIWRYPIKSLQGEALAACTVEARGVPHDRQWAVYGGDGKIGSGKRTRRFRAMPGLLALHGRVIDDGLAIHFPDGRHFTGPGADLDAALSAWLGETVRVCAEDAIRHHDDAPLHLVTTAACCDLGRKMPDGAAVDARRFRPNLVIEAVAGRDGSPADPLGDIVLLGSRIALGSAVLQITAHTERCVMIGMAQPGLTADPKILRVLAEPGLACFGVYAEIESAGTIRCGDAIERL